MGLCFTSCLAMLLLKQDGLGLPRQPQERDVALWDDLEEEDEGLRLAVGHR